MLRRLSIALRFACQIRSSQRFRGRLVAFGQIGPMRGERFRGCGFLLSQRLFVRRQRLNRGGVLRRGALRLCLRLVVHRAERGRAGIHRRQLAEHRILVRPRRERGDHHPIAHRPIGFRRVRHGAENVGARLLLAGFERRRFRLRIGDAVLQLATQIRPVTRRFGMARGNQAVGNRVVVIDKMARLRVQLTVLFHQIAGERHAFARTRLFRHLVLFLLLEQRQMRRIQPEARLFVLVLDPLLLLLVVLLDRLTGNLAQLLDRA